MRARKIVGPASLVNILKTYILPGDTRRSTRELPRRTPVAHFLRAKLEAWRHKMFHFLQSGMVFEIVTPFSCIFKAISSDKSCLVSVPFLTCELDVTTVCFFPPANPDWSIQISRAPAVCKDDKTFYFSVCVRFKGSISVLASFLFLFMVAISCFVHRSAM